MVNDKFIIKNYKCFDNNGSGFESIYPINIILGKNNSGKSSLVEAIKILVNIRNEDNANLQILFEHIITESDISTVAHNKQFSISTLNEWLIGNVTSTAISFKYIQYSNLAEHLIHQEFSKDNYQLREFRNNIAYRNIEKYTQKHIYEMVADRDIKPEFYDDKKQLLENGTGATNLITQILTKADENSSLINIDLLKAMNDITTPDIVFNKVETQRIGENVWEIFFTNQLNLKVPLSKMGSGIKTIILLLLNMIVLPKLDKLDYSECLFIFEEIENNLHPALQRNIFNYLKAFSKVNDTHIFITTHSNIAIDIFYNEDNAQILHVWNENGISKVSKVNTSDDVSLIIDDLGIKASDILQANGIIWVEGPSDRNFIIQWLSICAPEFKEGVHYAIMFYGGKLLSNLTFQREWINEELIPLLRINRNAFVVIDRDEISSKAQIRLTKRKIKDEIGDNKCWITQGREIEHYIHNNTLRNWALTKYNSHIDFNNGIDDKFDIDFRKANTISRKLGGKVIYSDNKTIFSREISQFITDEELDVLDLKQNINKIIKQIKSWNKQ